MKGFKNIYYDRNRNKLVLWKINDEGKTVKCNIKPNIEYYVSDDTGKSEVKDIWGNPVKKQISRNVYTLNKSIETANLVTCEAKLNQDLKYLQKEYGGKDLTYDMDDFQVCTIDIELAVGSDPKPFEDMVEDCDTPINLITVHFSKDDSVHTFGAHEYTGNSDEVGVYHHVPDEALLLERFIKLFRRKHVDILTGWNCLDSKSSVWLDDKIISINDALEGNITFDDGSIKRVVNTGIKTGYKIKLKDGCNVIASDSHVFPVYTKGVDSYIHPNPLLSSKEDIKVSQIDTSCRDYYMRVDLRDNKNANFSINGVDVHNDLLYLLGLLYTDGSCDRKENILMIYNKNKNIINNALHIMSEFNLRKNHITVDECYKNGRVGDDIYRARFSFKNNILNDLIHLVYNKDYRKELNLIMLSKLSYTQFTSFMSGCIDGDGWVGKNDKVIGFCNFNNDDIHKFSELLKWNGVYNVLYTNSLRIPRKIINSKFYKTLTLHHEVKHTRLTSGTFIDIKNTPSKKLKQFFYEGYYLIKVDSVESIGDVPMYDIETENHYFNTNGGIKTHNCKIFDMRYIIDRCEKLGVSVSLSPLNFYINTTEMDDFGNRRKYYKIPGISILDGRDLYKNFTFTKEVSYKLGFIGKVVTGEGKLDLDESINQSYKTNWNQFVEYNIQDVMLVKKINDKKKFIELAINLCYQALVPFESIFSSIQVITGYIVKYLHKYNLVMPDIEMSAKEHYPGGYVKGIRGIYKYLVSYDYESLYPRIMSMFNISPETLVMNPTKEQLETMDLIKTPASTLYKCDTPRGAFETEGIYYRKDIKGIVPQIVETIFNERKYFKDKMKVAKGYEKRLTPDKISENTHMDLKYVSKLYDEIISEGFDSNYYNSQQQIRKILINSIYGVLGNQYFAFYNINNAMAITIGGRDIIQYVSNSVNDYFHKYWHKTCHKYFPEFKGKTIEPITGDMVPVIDTDSNYICLDEVIQKMGLSFETDEDYRVWVDHLDQIFFKPFFKKILDIYAKKHNADNVHNFKREKIITRKLVSQKKRYADMVIENEGDVYSEPKLSITGLDIVKSSTPTYCRKNLKTALEFMLMISDRDKTADMLREMYTGFKNSPIEDISSPRRVNNYTKYAEPVDFYIDNGLRIKKGTPQHVKSSIYYNFFIKKKQLMYQYIENGSDIKYIYIKPNNSMRAATISYAGGYPKEFHDYFIIDYDTQWTKTFVNVIEDFYDVFGWGKVVLEKDNLSDFIKF